MKWNLVGNIRCEENTRECLVFLDLSPVYIITESQNNVAALVHSMTEK
jgi:hypothetical protein